MTENAVSTEPRQKAPQKKPSVEAGGSITSIVPRNIDETYRLSQALAAAGDLVPEHYRGRPEATMAAIVRGMEVGLAPMQALSNIAVINGRASLWGDALPALVQRAGHTLDVELEGDGEHAVAVATLERGDTGKKIVRRFSMADARQAQLLNKKGPWLQYPKRMLSMRARAWAARDGAADALMGLSVAEEVSDYGPDGARDVTPRESRRKPRRGGVVYADADPDPAPEPEPEPAAIEQAHAPEVDEIHGGEVIADDPHELTAEEADRIRDEIDADHAAQGGRRWRA